MTYDGFPVDVAADRLKDLCPMCGCIECVCEEWHRRSKPFTDAALKRLAGQLELAEEQGWRFERYAVCGVREHRHRYWIVARLCDWLPKV